MARIKDTKIKSDYEQNEQTLTFKQKFAKFYNSWFKNMSSIRQILYWYLIISITGALLLWMPFTHTAAHKGFGSVNFIDALFISSSAFSDTGLSTIGISEYFNFWGQLTTLILLSIGGVGWFTIKIFILQFILRKKTTYKTVSDAASEVGTHKKNETLGLIFSAVIISLSATVIFGFLFSFIFCFTEPNSLIYSGNIIDGISDVNTSADLGLYNNYGKSLWTGLYHASTSVNNSGLDIFVGDNSLAVYYQGANGIIIQLLTIMLFVIGGIGFGVFYDFWLWLKFRTSGKAFSFSLITKISVITYAVIALFGLSLAYLFEGIDYASSNNSFVDTQLAAGSTKAAAWWSITFNTFSTRNAGFSTINLGELSEATKILYSMMMFIGSGPGSTAGGLRTTTVAVLAIAAWTDIRGKNTYQVMNRNVPNSIVRQALSIFVSSLILIGIWVLVIGTTEALSHNKEMGLVDDVFVVFSAFGTTGLSTIDIGSYHWLSKLMLIILMFLGQMGMSTTLSQFKAKKIKYQREYIEETINLG